jgi:hypothetical protein
VSALLPVSSSVLIVNSERFGLDYVVCSQTSVHIWFMVV